MIVCQLALQDRMSHIFSQNKKLAYLKCPDAKRTSNDKLGKLTTQRPHFQMKKYLHNVHILYCYELTPISYKYILMNITYRVHFSVIFCCNHPLYRV